jgi:hypothetical protein
MDTMAALFEAMSSTPAAGPASLRQQPHPPAMMRCLRLDCHGPLRRPVRVAHLRGLPSTLGMDNDPPLAGDST